MEDQHEREVEAWDTSCRIMFRVMSAYRRICAHRNTADHARNANAPTVRAVLAKSAQRGPLWRVSTIVSITYARILPKQACLFHLAAVNTTKR